MIIVILGKTFKEVKDYQDYNVGDRHDMVVMVCMSRSQVENFQNHHCHCHKGVLWSYHMGYNKIRHSNACYEDHH